MLGVASGPSGARSGGLGPFRFRWAYDFLGLRAPWGLGSFESPLGLKALWGLGVCSSRWADDACQHILRGNKNHSSTPRVLGVASGPSGARSGGLGPFRFRWAYDLLGLRALWGLGPLGA